MCIAVIVSLSSNGALTFSEALHDTLCERTLSHDDGCSTGPLPWQVFDRLVLSKPTILEAIGCVLFDLTPVEAVKDYMYPLHMYVTQQLRIRSLLTNTSSAKIEQFLGGIRGYLHLHIFAGSTSHPLAQ